MAYSHPAILHHAHSVLRMLDWIKNHPLTRGKKAKALSRYIAYQVGSRMLPGPVVVPFVNSTRLLVLPHMAGATLNMYFGLAEFEEMGLVLHALRPDDLFVDIGANIGSYTVIASGAIGAYCFAFEPVPTTFARLLDNIRLNDIASKVSAKNMAVGSASGFVNFTTTEDLANHVVSVGEKSANSMVVPVVTLDDALSESPVTLIKIDVEGFETEVIKGASAALQSPSLLAIIMELNGSGSRYGFDETKLHKYMGELDFELVEYNPLRRKLTPVGRKPLDRANAVYARDIERLRERVENAPRFHVHGASL